MKPGTITSTLVAIVVSLQLVSLVTVTQATQTRLHDQAKLLAVHELDVTAKSLVIQTQQFLAPITSQLLISRQLFADGLLNTMNNRTLERYFLSQLRANVSMNSMYLGRYDGSFVAITRFERSLIAGYKKPVFRAKVSSVFNDNLRSTEWREYSLLGEELRHWTDDTGVYDPRQREWYINARVHDRPVWTDAYSSTDNQKLNIAASVNLRDQANADAGVLGVSVDLTQLSALVSAIPKNQQTSLFIFDNNFNQIAPLTPRSLQSGQEARKYTIESLWNEGLLDQRSRRSLPPIDTRGNRLSAVDRHWYSAGDTQANVLRRIQLFDGALHWRILLQTPLSELENMHKEVMLESLYRTMAIIVLPGLIALFVIFGLRSPLQRLHRRATIDYLTKALNREEFINRFGRRLDKARQSTRTRFQWAVVALDLDGFKQINDQFGHQAGDDILKAVVTRLQQAVGRQGFVGRLGGDEFAIALKIQSGADAATAVEHIRRQVVSGPILSAQARHYIGMTAGVAFARPEEAVTVLLERADMELVSGKAVQKNTTYCATPDDPESYPRVLRSRNRQNKGSVIPVANLCEADVLDHTG